MGTIFLVLYNCIQRRSTDFSFQNWPVSVSHLTAEIAGFSGFDELLAALGHGLH